MKKTKLFLPLFFFIECFLTQSYVLNENIKGYECKIGEKDTINIVFDKNLCNREFSYIDPFRFNNCNELKISIIQGIKLWSKNTDSLKITYNKNNNNKVYIDVSITNNMNNKIASDNVAHANRICNKKLENGNIVLNNKCFYPDNFICISENFELLCLFLLFLLFYSLLNIISITKFELWDNNFILTLITIKFFIYLVTFLYLLFKCNNCYSLKTTISHEFGHIIGFEHPDQHYYYNYKSSYNKCKITKEIDQQYDKKSIMISTYNRRIIQLSLDDKLGLYDLYPSCNFNTSIYNNFEPFNINNEFFFIIYTIFVVLTVIFIFMYKLYIELKNYFNKELIQTDIELYSINY